MFRLCVTCVRGGSNVTYYALHLKIKGDSSVAGCVLYVKIIGGSSVTCYPIHVKIRGVPVYHPGQF